MLSGDRLKFLRYTHEKTQAQIADWCNVSVRYVGMVESGEEIPTKQVYGAWLNCCYGVGNYMLSDNSSHMLHLPDLIQTPVQFHQHHYGHL